MALVTDNGESSAGFILSNELHPKFTKETLFKPVERDVATFMDGLKDMTGLPSMPLAGAGLFWRVDDYMGDGTGSPGELSAWPSASPRGQFQLSTLESTFQATLEFSDLVAQKAVGGDASYSDVISDLIFANTTKHALRQEMMALGDGTGRYGIVNAATINSTSFVCKIADSGVGGSVKIRRGMDLEFATAASGGTVQVTAKVRNVKNATGVVTLDQAVSLDAGWHIFKAGTYGQTVPIGLDTIVEDGGTAFTPTSGGTPVDRSVSSVLQAVVNGDPATVVPYSRDLIDALLFAVDIDGDGTVPDELLSNAGIQMEHQRIAAQDRLVMVQPASGAQQPTTVGGKTSNLTYQYGDAAIPFNKNYNIAPRTLYALDRSSFGKATLTETQWFAGFKSLGSSPGSIFMLKPTGDNWSTVWEAMLIARWATVAKYFNRNGKQLGIRDTRFGDPA